MADRSDAGTPRGRRRAGAVVLALLALGVAWPEEASAQASPFHGTIRGRASDEYNDHPLSGARVEFLDDSRRVRATVLADESGYFVMGQLPAGAFRLRVTHFGYLRTTTPVWWVHAGEILDVAVRLRPDALPLAPLEVVALTKVPMPVLADFHRRRESAVTGFFLARRDIDERKPSRVTDLLVDVPGIRLESVPGYSGQARGVTFARSLLATGGGRCPVQVFLDGILATRGGSVPLDDLVSPEDLEGVEVYRGLGSVPAEFVTPEARCGVVALWTRRGVGAR